MYTRPDTICAAQCYVCNDISKYVRCTRVNSTARIVYIHCAYLILKSGYLYHSKLLFGMTGRFVKTNDELEQKKIGGLEFKG